MANPGSGFGPMGNPLRGKGMVPSNAGAPSFDTDTVNAALKPYGVSMPTEYSSPGVLGNTSWGQAHPGIATGVDNALIALGNMGPTGATAGENISNAARGIMGVQPYRQQYASQQAMMPFQYAKEIGGLQAQQSYMKMQDAMGNYYADRGQSALEANQVRLQTANMKANIESAKELQIGKDAQGNESVMRYQFDPDTMQGQYLPDPNLDVKAFKQQKKIGGLQQTFGSDDRGRFMMTQMAQHFKGIDNIPADPGQWDKAAVKAYADSVNTWGRMQPGFMTGMAGLSQRKSEDWYKQQKDLFANIHSSMKAPTSKDLDSVEKAARDADFTTSKSFSHAKAAGQQARTQAESDWSSKVTSLGQAYASFHDLPSDQQDHYGNFANYWSQQSGQPIPGGAPSGSPAATSDPVASFLNALKKPK